jgi:hypothetical protein
MSAAAVTAWRPKPFPDLAFDDRAISHDMERAAFNAGTYSNDERLPPVDFH